MENNNIQIIKTPTFTETTVSLLQSQNINTTFSNSKFSHPKRKNISTSTLSLLDIKKIRKDVYGKIIKLNGEGKSKTGESKRGAAIGCGVFFGIVLCPIGLLFLCIKGENPEIPKGTLMMATATLN